MSRKSYYSGSDVRRAISYHDLRAMARRRLPQFVAEYVEGGAEDERTLRNNRLAFEDVTLRHRVLRGVDAIDTTAPVFGRSAKLPMIIAPTGFNGLLWSQGDKALALAAAAAGIPFTQSTVSNERIEDVAGAGGRHWMQLYFLRDRDAVETIIARAERAGCETLALTVDSTTYGNREWDKRSYSKGISLTMRSKVDVLRRWRWMSNVLVRGIPGFVNLYEFLPPNEQGFLASANWARQQVDPTLDWSIIPWLRDRWKGKLVLKGIGHLRDAQLAADMGVDGIVLSNHGGRQLDDGLSPLTLLPAVRDHLGDQVSIFVDSGIRRGADIAKAIMLGADAVLVGRVMLYGLAAGGQTGVSRAIEILGEEFVRVMALLGVRNLDELRGCRE